jgi:acyl carrier protein
MATPLRDDILRELTGYLEELFEVPPERVTLDARLYEDLELDSIDAIDLVVKLQQFTNRKFKPEEFRSARTIGDVLDRVEGLWNA